MCLTGKAYAFFCVLLSALLHEAAHAAAAINQGYNSTSVTLMPYGAVLNSTDNLDKSSEVVIAAAGPIASFMLALITVAFWWLAPESFAYTKPFYLATLTVGVFNLIPVFPLDGSRIVLGLTKNRLQTLKLLKYSGIGFSFILLAFFVASAFNEINYTLGILAVFLFAGATAGTKSEMYIHILNNSPLSKAYGEGVREETVIISEDLILKRLIRLINNKSIKTFKLINGETKITATLSESEMLSIISKNKPTTALKNAVKIIKN